MSGRIDIVFYGVILSRRRRISLTNETLRFAQGDKRASEVH